ncbi:AfaD family invasin [Enterobacter bugandensis]
MKHILLLLLFLIITPALSMTVPELNIQMVKGQPAGIVTDGAQLGIARLMYGEPHQGFHLWSDNSEGRVGRFLLEGVKNKRNKLRVRLEKEGGPSVTDTAKGIIIRTQDRSVILNIVADGNQHVPADEYLLNITVASLLTNEPFY